MSRNPKAAAARLAKAKGRLRAIANAPCFTIRLDRGAVSKPPADPSLSRFAAPAKAPHVCGPLCIVVAVELADAEVPQC